MVFGFRSLCCRFACESSLQTGRYTWVQRGFLALCWWSQILLSRPINPEPSHDKLGVRRVGGQLGERDGQREAQRRSCTEPSLFHWESFTWFILVWLFEMTTNRHSVTDWLSVCQTEALTKGPKEWWSDGKQTARVRLSILSFRGNRESITA